MAHICSVRSGVSVFQRAPFQLPRPGPSCPPTRATNTAKTQSQQRSSSLPAPPSHHSKAEPEPSGGLGSMCQSPRGAGSPGAAAVLPAVAKIVHFVWQKSAQSFLLQLESGGRGFESPPHRSDFHCRQSLPPLPPFSWLNGTKTEN